jgi:hypothetical protein
MTTPSRRSNKWKRPNVWLGKIIPPLLVVFGYYGYRLVLLDVCQSTPPFISLQSPSLNGLTNDATRDTDPLLRTYSTSLARVYISWVNTFLALVIWNYSLVYFHSNKSRKGRSIPLEVQEKRVVRLVIIFHQDLGRKKLTIPSTGLRMQCRWTTASLLSGRLRRQLPFDPDSSLPRLPNLSSRIRSPLRFHGQLRFNFVDFQAFRQFHLLCRTPPRGSSRSARTSPTTSLS